MTADYYGTTGKLIRAAHYVPHLKGSWRTLPSMDWNRYRFISTWHLDAPPDVVYRALKVTDDYPLWWPEVRRVRRIDDQRAEMVVRSLLPYDLTFIAEEARQDQQAGVLEATMSGDLDGFSRWTLSADTEADGDGDGTRAVFEEEVVARKALLRRSAVLARPAFRANHALMMRHGRQGLRVYLAGYRAASRPR